MGRCGSWSWRSVGVMQFGNAGGLLLNIDTASWFKVTQSTRPKKRQPLIALTLQRSLCSLQSACVPSLGYISSQCNTRYRSWTNDEMFSWSFKFLLLFFYVPSIKAPSSYPRRSHVCGTESRFQWSACAVQWCFPFWTVIHSVPASWCALPSLGLKCVRVMGIKCKVWMWFTSWIHALRLFLSELLANAFNTKRILLRWLLSSV